MSADIQTIPVAGWDIKFVVSLQAVIFTPHILPNLSAGIDEAVVLPNLILTRLQVESLIDALQRSLKALGSAGTQGAPFLNG